MFLHLWPVEMASQSIIGLVERSIAKGGVDLVQNLIVDSGVAILCVGNAKPDLMLLGVVDDAIVSGVP